MTNDLIRDDATVADLAGRAGEAGTLVLDLEFVSEGRYVPDLGLVQVAFGDPGAPAVAAVDPLEADPRPVLALVGEPDVRVILHGGQADLSLISDHFDIAPRRIIDTQIAAAFLGLGDQSGFGRLVQRVLGVDVDKGAQFTDWLRRPLDPDQLRYALDDVRLLMPVWADLEARLRSRGRMAWVEAESLRMAERAATRPPPEEAYRKVSGWRKVKGDALGSLRALAAWRERLALETNRPPARILSDRVMTTLARRTPDSPGGLAKMRGMNQGTARRHGREILEVLEEGRRQPVEQSSGGRGKDPVVDALSPIVAGIIQARCREAEIAARFVARRKDIEATLRWWRDGASPTAAREHDLLHGWRRDLVGDEVLAFLAGRRALLVDPEEEGGFRLIDAP
ncbi:MAG: ribonuclease D [Myxococcota bacterium]